MQDDRSIIPADEVLGKLLACLEGRELGKIPRERDMRLVVVNHTNGVVTFPNPGRHSDGKEVIPHGKAVMVELQGDTLEAQMGNAEKLSRLLIRQPVRWFFDQLAQPGSNEVSPLVKEAYGPTKYADATKGLTRAKYSNVASMASRGATWAYGVRPERLERVFLVKMEVPFALKGTNTSPENATGTGTGTGKYVIAVAVGENNHTRPIVYGQALEFYGDGFAGKVPVATVTRGPNGIIEVKVELPGAQGGNMEPPLEEGPEPPSGF